MKKQRFTESQIMRIEVASQICTFGYAQSKFVKFEAKEDREYEKDEKGSRRGIQSQGGNIFDPGR